MSAVVGQIEKKFGVVVLWGERSTLELTESVLPTVLLALWIYGAGKLARLNLFEQVENNGGFVRRYEVGNPNVLNKGLAVQVKQQADAKRRRVAAD